MKKLLLLTSALLVISASMAMAAGDRVRLSWDDCGAAGAEVTANLCTSNAPANDKFLVSSFFGPGTLPNWVGIRVIIKLSADDGSIPDWWRNDGCHTSNGWQLTFPGAIGLATCNDPWASSVNPPGGGYLWISGDGGPARATVYNDAARDTPEPINSGPEYYALVNVVKAIKTTGVGACVGCLEPVVLVLDEILLYQQVGSPGGDIISLKNSPTPATIACAKYNGGLSCEATPARNATWGGLKKLYR